MKVDTAGSTQIPVTTLRVTPPGGRESLDLPFPLTYSSANGLHIGFVVPGTLGGLPPA